MKLRPLPFRAEFLPLIAGGSKTETRRCSGLAGVNIEPGEWQLDCGSAEGVAVFYDRQLGDGGYELHCHCPWRIGPTEFCNVTDIRVERLHDMTPDAARAEGMVDFVGDDGDHRYRWPWEAPALAIRDYRAVLARLWDSIHRRDVNNRYARNPWVWVLTIAPREG